MASYQFNPINILDTSNATSLTDGGSMTLGGGISIGKDALIGGNVSISGTTTSFSDNILLINKNPSISTDTGIIFQRYTSDIQNNNNYAGIIYSEQNDTFNLGYLISDADRNYVSIGSLISLNAKDITTGNVNMTGNLYKNGTLYNPGSQWVSVNSDILYTTGKVITSDLIGTNISGTNLRLSGDLYVAGTLSVVNVTTTNVVDINISTGTITASGMSTLTNVIATAISTGTINVSTGLTTSTLLATTSISSGSIQCTNAVNTALSTGTINVSTGITTAALLNTGLISSANLASTTATVPNIIHTNISTGTINASGLSSLANVTATNASVGVLVASTGITTGNINVTSLATINNATVTTATVATLLTTDVISTNVSAGTMNLSTGITAGSARITNANLTTATVGTLVNTNATVITATVGTLINTNAVSTNVSAGTMNLSTGITTGSARITNANITNVTAGDAKITNLSSTNSSIGSFVSGAGTVGGHLVPSANITYDIGSATQRWRDIYLSGNTIYLGDKQLSLAGDTFELENISVISTKEATSTTSAALVVSGGVGIRGKLRVAGTSYIDTAEITTITASNIVASNVSSATFVASIGITTGTISASGVSSLANVIATNASVGGLNATGLSSLVNATATNVSVGVLIASTGITAASAQITNIVATTISAGTILGNISSANIAVTAVSAGTLLATIRVSSANLNASTISAGTIVVAGNILSNTHTSISNQGIHLAWNRSNADGESWIINQKGGGTANSGIRFGRSDTSNNVTELMRIQDSGNVGIGTNNPGTTLDVSGTFRATTSVTSGALYATNVTATNIVATTISAGTVVGNISSANITASLITAGTVNAATLVSSANIAASLITVGTVNASTLISSANIAASLITVGTVNAATLISSANIAASLITVGTLVGSTINGTNSTITNVVNTALSTGTLRATAIDISTTSNAPMNIASTYSVGANGYSHSIKSYNSNMAANEVVSHNIGRSSTTRNEAYFGFCHVTSGSTSNYATIGLNAVDRILNINGSGNVGINTTSPGTTLDVSGTFRATTSITTGLLNATNVTATNIVATTISAGTILGSTLISSANIAASVITTGTLNASALVSSANIAASVITTGTLNAATLVSSANIAASVITAGTLNAATLVSSANIAASVITTGTLNAATLVSSANIAAFVITAGTLNAATLVSSANIAASVITAGSLVATTRVSSANLNSSAISTGIMYLNSASGTNIAISPQNGAFGTIEAFTTGNTAKLPILLTPYGGNVGVNMNSTPGASLDVSGTFRATTSITTAALFATNVTATNIVGTTISAGTLLAATITGGNLSLSGNLVVGGTLTTVNITSTNILNTNISIGTISATGLSSLANVTATNISVGGINASGLSVLVNVTATNIVGTTISAGTLVGTIITGGNLSVSGTITAGTIITSNVTATNIVGTSISAGTLLATTITGGNLSLSGNITIGTLLATTRVSSANLNTSVISAGTLVGTTITGGNLSLSGNITIGTLLATTRVSSANLNSSLISTGTLNVSNSLSIGAASAGSGIDLDIIDTTVSSNAPFLRLANSAGGAGNKVGIKLSPYSGRSGGDSSQIIAVDDGAASSHLLFYTASGDAGASTERMRIMNSGYVGIGTNNPQTLLEVSGTAIANGIRHSNNTCSIETYNDGTDGWLQTFSNNALKFGINNASAIMTLNTNGNIGIGTETPPSGTKLQVVGNVGIGTGAGSDNKAGILDVRTSSVAYSSGTLMSEYALTLSHNTSTFGSLGIAFGILSGGSITPGASIIHERTGTNSVGLLHFCTKSGTVSNSPNLIRMTIQTSGNVGIGTTAPTYTLDVTGTCDVSTSITTAALYSTNITATNIVGTTISAGTLVLSNANLSSATIGTLLGTTRVSSANIAASIISTGTIRITSNLLALGNSNTIGNIFTTGGNVGIATGTPESKLHVNGAITIEGETVSNAQVDSSNLTQTYISFKQNGSSNDWAYLRQIGTSNEYLIALDIHDDGNEPGFCIRSITSTSNPDTVNERFRVQANGNVGINTASPSKTLHVNGDILADNINVGEVGRFDSSNFKTGYGGFNVGYIATSNADGSINTYSSYNSLTRDGLYLRNGWIEVTGSVTANPGGCNYFVTGMNLIQGTSNFGNTAISIKATGSIWSGDKFISTSDLRVKKNRTKLDTNDCLEIINNIEPVTFNFIDTIQYTQNKSYGFIAQEIEKIIPDAIITTSNFIPSIMEVCDVEKIGTNKYKIQLSKELNKNAKKIKMYDIDNKIYEADIEIYDENKKELIISNENDLLEQMFIYGEEILDFKTLEKDVIWTITTAAVKELNIKLEQEKQKVAILQEQYQDLLSRISNLESM